VRVISQEGAEVYEDSVAIIPDKISDQDAIATCIHSLAAIHCTMPRLDGVGGSSSDDVANSFVSGRVVVLGGNDLACFAAHGLAALGVHVSLVSTGSPKVKKPSSSNAGAVDIMKPAIGKSNEGFASAIGRFDALLDTTHDERPAWIFNGKRLDTNEEDFGGVIRLLKSRHGCNRYVHPNNSRVFCYPSWLKTLLVLSHSLFLSLTNVSCRYVSTVSHAQRLVGEKGVMMGPRNADEYLQMAASSSFLSSPDCQQFPSPSKLGRTIEALLRQGVIYSDKQNKKSPFLRGWSLADFWEQTTW
jgi:hypothetical protein